MDTSIDVDAGTRVFHAALFTAASIKSMKCAERGVTQYAI